MRLPSRRAAASVLSLSALVLGVSACGSDESTSADAPAAESSDTTETTESPEAGAEESPEDTPEEGGEALEEGQQVEPTELLDRMKGAVADATSARFTMEMMTGGQALTAEGALAYADTGNELEMSMSLPGAGKMQMIAADGELFAAIPNQTPAGKFIRIDPNDPTMKPFADQMQSMDPLSSFDAFDAGLRKVTYLGESPLDGESMEHYRLEVDSAAAAKAQGAQGMDAGTAGLPDMITYELWLDSDDHMRQVAFDLAGVEATMTMSAWGEPVDIEAPPAWKVVEMP